MKGTAVAANRRQRLISRALRGPASLLVVLTDWACDPPRNSRAHTVKPTICFLDRAIQEFRPVLPWMASRRPRKQMALQIEPILDEQVLIHRTHLPGESA